jgi:general stress protein YciG
MDDSVRKYLAEIGRKGGRASRRKLDRETARAMVRVREARRAYKRFHASCFWSYPPDLSIQGSDVHWVARTLMKNGNREAWEVGRRICP